MKQGIGKIKEFLGTSASISEKNPSGLSFFRRVASRKVKSNPVVKIVQSFRIIRKLCGRRGQCGGRHFVIRDK
jgi:hypothetical protein